MTVHEALAAVMADVQAVAKKDRNEHQKFSFRGIDAVVNAVGPALRKHGVVVVPSVDEVTYETVATTTGKPSTACRVLVTYTFWKGDSSLSCRVAAEAWDAGDKATPKAMSVAFRTALLQALALPTDEPDPDVSSYERAPAPSHAELLSKVEELLHDADDLVEADKVREYAAGGSAQAQASIDRLTALLSGVNA